MSDQPAQERFYKAFISYRHKQLDIWTAKTLHRRIERYIIPRDLRSDGNKKLGLVFRDQDELPIANSLSENIRTALDHSEFLIVICTPDTPGSVWVQREISYFLEHHDRDHVLAVLAAGEPDESFPDQLTRIRDSSGNVLEEVEPLAANILAETDRKRRGLFKTESLRILASLIGCPYDALYRREQRYRRRRIAAAAAAVAVTAMAFIGMLLNRNAKIREQLLISKANESKALAALSTASFRDGDYRGAINYALDALPGRDPDRPYVPEAEYALADELYLYRSGLNLRYIQSCDQDTQIVETALSSDGKLLATVDRYYLVRMYETSAGRLLWEYPYGGFPYDTFFIPEGFLLSGSEGTVLLSASDGQVVWNDPKLNVSDVHGETGVCLGHFQDQNIQTFCLVNTENGEILYRTAPSDQKYTVQFAAALSPDGKRAAFVKEEEDSTGRLYLWDLENGTCTVLQDNLACSSSSTFYGVSYRDENTLVLACTGDEDLLKKRYENWEGCFVMLFDGTKEWSRRFCTIVNFGSAVQPNNGLFDGIGYMDFLAFMGDGITVASKYRLVNLDCETGKTLWQKDLPGRVIAAKAFDNGSAALVLSDGIITLCTSDGTLSYEHAMGSFECGFDLNSASCSGDRYRAAAYAVVPSGSRSRVTLISFCNNRYLSRIPGTEDLNQSIDLLASPSDSLLAAYTYDSNEKSLQVMLMDPSGEREPDRYTLQDISYSDITKDRVFVTDRGTIILGGKIIDPRTGAVQTFIENDYRLQILRAGSVSCKVSADSSILTAAADWDNLKAAYVVNLYRDGEWMDTAAIPCSGASSGDLTRCSCDAVGPLGYVAVSTQTQSGEPVHRLVYSTEERRWLDASFLDQESDEILAMAGSHPWMAVQTMDRDLNIYDLNALSEPSAIGADSAADGGTAASGTADGTGTVQPLLKIENSVPGQSVAKLLFFREDTRLAVFTSGGDLLIYDTGDGSLLHRSSYSREMLWFDTDGRYEIRESAENGKTFIQFDSIQYGDPVCLALDRDSFETAGFYNGFSLWIPSNNRVFVTPYLDGIQCGHLFSLEELRAMAEELLGGE